MRVKVYVNMNIPDGFKPVQILSMENGCCPDRPVIVTGNMLSDWSVNYSAQCACGLWCTTGCASPEDAVSEYKRMTSRARSRRNAREGRKYV